MLFSSAPAKISLTSLVELDELCSQPLGSEKQLSLPPRKSLSQPRTPTRPSRSSPGAAAISCRHDSMAHGFARCPRGAHPAQCAPRGEGSSGRVLECHNMCILHSWCKPSKHSTNTISRLNNRPCVLSRCMRFFFSLSSCSWAASCGPADERSRANPRPKCSAL